MLGLMKPQGTVLFCDVVMNLKHGTDTSGVGSTTGAELWEVRDGDAFANL